MEYCDQSGLENKQHVKRNETDVLIVKNMFLLPKKKKTQPRLESCFCNLELGVWKIMGVFHLGDSLRSKRAPGVKL